LNQLGERFVGVYFRAEGSIPAGLDEVGTESIPVATLVVSVTATGPGLITDTSGLLHRHYDARPGTYYLVRPDQHIAGRWREFNRDKAATALARATGRAG